MTKRVKKIMTIVLSIGAAAITAWGVYVISNREMWGEEKHLAEVSETISVIRDTEERHLTDEQFIYGIENLVPPCSLSEIEQINTINAIYADINKIVTGAHVDFINWYGNPACKIAVPASVDISQLIAIISYYPYLTRVYINCTDDVENVQESYLFTKGTLTQIYPRESDDVDLKEIDVLINDLVEQYAISRDCITVKSSGVTIADSALLETSALNVFDYAYQWFYSRDIPATITIEKDGALLASAQIDLADENYERYYPTSELSPLYRILVYDMNNYFFGTLQQVCKLYL